VCYNNLSNIKKEKKMKKTLLSMAAVALISTAFVNEVSATETIRIDSETMRVNEESVVFENGVRVPAVAIAGALQELKQMPPTEDYGSWMEAFVVSAVKARLPEKVALAMVGAIEDIELVKKEILPSEALEEVLKELINYYEMKGNGPKYDFPDTTEKPRPE
jgi:hypothetical protein